MGNYSNQIGLIHFTLCTSNKEYIKEGLYNIFAEDLDFVENVEYFRKKTLKLGYRNEADRLVDEYMQKHKKINTLSSVMNAVDKLAAKVFNNSNQYSEHKVSVEQISDNLFSIAISYGM